MKTKGFVRTLSYWSGVSVFAATVLLQPMALSAQYYSSSSVSSSSSLSSSSSSSSAGNEAVSFDGASFDAKVMSSKRVAVAFVPPTTVPDSLFIRTEVVGSDGQTAYVMNEPGKWSRLPVSYFNPNDDDTFSLTGVISFVNKNSGIVVESKNFKIYSLRTIEPLTWRMAPEGSITYEVEGGKGPYITSIWKAYVPEWMSGPVLLAKTMWPQPYGATFTYTYIMTGVYEITVWNQYVLDGETWIDDKLTAIKTVLY